MQDDIVVVFTNDTHCGITDGIGFAGLAAYVDLMEEKTPYVTVVDCGDAVQGEVIGTVTEGESIVSIMNEVGYDFAVLGNHEFDFGMEQLSFLLEKSEAQYLGANISYLGDGESPVDRLKPYEIVSCGDRDVAFIGLSTPWSISSSTPAFFMDEAGEYVYDFAAGEDGGKFYTLTQQYVDECRAAGADYVIVLCHLGDMGEMSPYSTPELIANTTGIDAVLDGHAHSVIPCDVLLNAAGEEVLLSSTGTKFQNIGQLVITASGNITLGLVSGFESVDDEVAAYVDSVLALYEEQVNEVVAVGDTALSGYDEAGIRMVRSRETTVGNFCADAYRAVAGADVTLLNGGGIRDDLPAGDITFADIVAIHPFGNTLCMAYVTGQEILDILEYGARAAEAVYAADGVAVGELGSFCQVSGLRYTVDTSIPTSVVLDENGVFMGVEGERRVTDVEILGENGEYVPIDPEATYTLASHSYLLKEDYPLLFDNEFIIDEGMIDYEILINYITDHLQGDLSSYSDVEGRITIQ